MIKKICINFEIQNIFLRFQFIIIVKIKVAWLKNYTEQKGWEGGV